MLSINIVSIYSIGKRALVIKKVEDLQQTGRCTLTCMHCKLHTDDVICASRHKITLDRPPFAFKAEILTYHIVTHALMVFNFVGNGENVMIILPSFFTLVVRANENHSKYSIKQTKF